MLFATALDDHPDPSVPASSVESSMQNDASGMKTFLTSTMGWDESAIRVFDLDWLENYPDRKTSIYHAERNKRAWDVVEKLKLAYVKSEGASTAAIKTLETLATSRAPCGEALHSQGVRCFKDLLTQPGRQPSAGAVVGARRPTGELSVQTEKGSFTVSLKLLASKLISVLNGLAATTGAPLAAGALAPMANPSSCRSCWWWTRASARSPSATSARACLRS